MYAMTHRRQEQMLQANGVNQLLQQQKNRKKVLQPAPPQLQILQSHLPDRMHPMQQQALHR